MEPDINTRLTTLEAKIDEIHESTRRIQNYLKITAWVTVIVVVLPLIGLLFAIPAMLSSLNEAMSIIQ